MRSRKAVYNIFINLILQVVVILYGFVVPKVIISNFGSNVNGLISSITQFLGYIVLLEGGFGQVVKAALYKPISNDDMNKISSILRTTETFFKRIAIVFLIYIVFLSIIFPTIVNKDFDVFFTISLILIIAVSSFAEFFFGMTYKLFLQAEQKNYVISFIQIITYIFSLIAIIILAKLNANVQVIKLASGIIFIMRPIVLNIYVKNKYNINYRNADSNYKLKSKWDGLAQHIASVIHSNTDITVLTIFSTLYEVSVYSVYYLVVRGVKQLVQSFSSGIDALFGDMLAKNEHDNLLKKFSLYEVLYLTIVTIVFSCTMILIVPFVSVYTRGITDADYIRPLFGYLIVVSEYIWAIRVPYSSLTLAAGHFKETRIGAWMECFVNIALSVVLVSNFGLIGVAIGTIVAMTVRTCEFVYHSNRYILNRSVMQSIIKILMVIIESTVVVIIFNNFIKLSIELSYIDWTCNAIIVLLITSFIILLINCVFYKNEIGSIVNLIKGLLRKKNKIKK